MKPFEHAGRHFGWGAAMVLSWACVTHAEVCDNTFKFTAANTPRSAYDWNTAANWTDGTLGVPDGWDAKAVFPVADTAPYFVTADTTPKVSDFKFNQRVYYIGDLDTGTHKTKSGSALFEGHASLVNGHLDDGSYIFGDLTSTKRAGSAKQCYYGPFQLAGHFRPGAFVDGTSSAAYAQVDMIVMRMDLFADDTNPVRTEPYHYNIRFIENGGFTLVGPRGADAHVSAWNLEAGSPYLQYAGEGLHGVVPGVTVTGAGIAPDTFVKYVFARTGWIALSKPVEANGTGANVSLQFGAITPSVTQYWPNYWQHGDGKRYLRVVKYRPEDGCTFVIGNVEMTDTGKSTYYTVWGLEKAMLDAGYIPGDIVVSNMTAASSLRYRNNRLETVNIRFAGDIESDYMKNLPAAEAYWQIPEKTAVAHLAVDAGKTANIYNLKNVRGTIVKDGSGTLLCHVADTVLGGKLLASEGTLEIARAAATAGQAIVVSNLTLAATACLKIPEDGLTVVNLSAEPGATVVGPGTLTVTGTISGTPSVDGGAVLDVAIRSLTREACVTAHAPWFNMDVSASGTLTTVERNGTNFITKIMDANGSGEYVKPYFEGEDYQPWLVPAATNGMPFVDLGPFSSTNGVARGQMRYPDRALRLYGANDVAYYGGKETEGTKGTVKADTPRKPVIRAAVFVVNTAGGGGSLLGASGDGYFSYGVVHGRDFSRSGETAAPIVCFDKASWESTYLGYANKSSIDSGATSFRVNGKGVYPRQEGFSGEYDVLSFRSTSGRTSSEFGHFYQEGSPNYENSANGFAFGEYILFTNELDDAAICAVEDYLQAKWYGRRKAGSYAEAKSVRVGVGSTLSLSGSDETLYAEGLTVAGGVIAGDVKLAEAASIEVEVSPSGEIAGLTVNGTLSLPAAGSVSLAGSVKTLKSGDYPICAATAVSGDVTAWTPPQDKHMTCSLRVVDNVLVLNVQKHGLAILVR